jgi:hypothetical protein
VKNWRPIVVFSLIALLTWFAACTGERAIPLPSPPPASSRPVALQVPASSDIQVQPGNRRPITVQILVDESGSMIGFVNPLRDLEGWLDRSVTRVEAYGFVLKSRNICGFREPSGVRCSATAPTGRHPSGGTNLDEAIEAAENADITVIVTDGVAATGSAHVRRCAGGVDASCVGESLGRYAVRDNGGGGIWLIPTKLPFSGRLYTERHIPASDFDPDIASKMVGESVKIGRASNTQSGELVFDYAGPRALLVFVLAKDVVLGRAYVAAMQDISAMEGFSRDRSGAKRVVGTFELFPGYVTPRKWTALRVSDEFPNVSHDATLDERTQTVTFTCGVQGQPEGEWIAASVPADASGIAVIPVESIPIMTGTLQIEGSELSATTLATDGSRIMLRMSCSSRIPECGKPAAVRISATRTAPDSSKFVELSTNTPERQPDKAFGLTDVIRSFYQRVGPMRPLPVAEMKVCAAKR